MIVAGIYSFNGGREYIEKNFKPELDGLLKATEAIDRLVTEAVETSKVELREKFGIDANKKYDVKIGNGVIVIQESQLTKEEK